MEGEDHLFLISFYPLLHLQEIANYGICATMNHLDLDELPQFSFCNVYGF